MYWFYMMNNGVQNAAGVAQQKEVDTNLKWETNEQTNIGLDFSFFNNELSFTMDYFIRDAKDLLLYRQIRPSTGFQEVYTNAGHIRNKGFEFTAAWNKSVGDWTWGISFNGSTLKNEAIEVGDDIFSRSSAAEDGAQWENHSITKNGYPVGSYYGWKVAGIFQSKEEIDALNAASPTGKYQEDTTKPGDYKFVDLNGDGQITDADRTVIGNALPDFYGGFTNTFNYANFDLSFMFQFSVGNDVFNATRLYSTQTKKERTNLLAEVADRWTPTNASNKVPSTEGYVNGEVYSRFVEDGSYLRLKNITLGYTFPVEWTRKFYVQKLRLYASAQNLFCLTKYTGYDPEVSTFSGSPMTPGVDWGAYPKTRVFTFGVDLSF